MNEETAKEWLKKAERDLKAANVLLREGIYDYSLFHSQQAVEKYLKAFLTYHNKHFGKTHNIPLLISICREIDPSFEQLLELDFSILFPIGVTIRYPTDREVTEEEAKEAIEISEKVKEFVLKKLGL